MFIIRDNITPDSLNGRCLSDECMRQADLMYGEIGPTYGRGLRSEHIRSV